MTDFAVPFALPWLVFALSWVILAPVAALIHVAMRRPLDRVEAPQRAVLLLALSLLPLTVAGLVALLGFAPEIGGWAVDGHCHANTGCHPHVPRLHASVLEAIWLGALIALATCGILLAVGLRLRRSVALVGTLLTLAPRARGDGFAIVETRARFAYCVGLWRPQIVVSRGLLTRLAPAELDAVLAHERAHAARFDNLRQWLAALSLWPLPRRLRRGLLHDLAAANDQSCDRFAADSAGCSALDHALVAFDGDAEQSVQRRRVLAAVSTDLSPTGVLALVVVSYAVCTLPVLDATHYGAELVLRWFG